MIKKFRFPGRLPLLSVLFVVWLLPSWRFSQASAPAFGSGDRADTIRCWEASFLLPVYGAAGHVDTSLKSSKRLYVEGDLMMYAYSYDYATGTDGVGQTSSGTGWYYLIYQKDSLSGIEYDDLFPARNGHFNVDSFRRSMVPYLKQFALLKGGAGRLVSTVSHAASGGLEETYCDINWVKHPNSDSCYITYSDRFNFLPREMSLEVKMDSLYQKKLCQFKMVIHPAPDQQNHRTYDRSEWIWRLEEVRDFNRDTIESYFARYLHDTGAAAGTPHR